MKKFTLFTFFVLIGWASIAQSDYAFEQKAQQVREKFKPLVKAGDLLLNYTNAQNYLAENHEVSLKSVAATHKLDSTVVWERPHGETEWNYLWKDEYHWDASQQTNTWIEKEWDDASQSLYVSSETVIEFDNEGMMQVIYNSYRYEPGDELLLEGKIVPEYNNSGRLETLQYFASDDDGENWYLEMEQVYAYNNSGQLTALEFWSLEEDVMLQSMRMVYTYNGEGQRTMSQSFFNMEEEEMLLSETHYEYNNSGQVVEEIDWSLSYTTFQLVKSMRIVTEYNASGEIDTETYYDWDEIDEVWLEDTKDEYSYSSLDFSDILLPYSAFLYDFMGMEFPELMGKATTEINSYSRIDDAWVHDEKQLFYYSSIGASNVEMLDDNDFAVYPNPVTDNVTFSWTGTKQQLMLEIFRLDGAKMLERQITSGQKIQVKNLESGVYLYNVKNGIETLSSGRLVKQ